ncbi:MAG: CPBP family intramembrane metalloprotease [Clostridia bacterium]|nr:CPBP family intramembrane metalloprotease [Clostridia bacterium]
MSAQGSGKGSFLTSVRRLLRSPRFRAENALTTLVLATYLLLLISRLLDATVISREDEYLSIILLQMLIFLVPAVVFCKLRGNDFTHRLQLRMFRPSHILLLITALLVMISGCLLIGIYTGGLESSRDGFVLYDTFSADTTRGAGAVLYRLLAFAALPALCEELVFRGIVCASLEERGTVCMVAFSSLYFGMLHFHPAQLPVYMFAGIVLCLVLFITRSLVASMVVHFLYNVFGLFGQTALSRFHAYTGNDEMFAFLATLVLLISAAVFCGEASRIYHRYARATLPPPDRPAVPLRELPAALLRTLFPLVGIICVFVYIIAAIFA